MTAPERINQAKMGQLQYSMSSYQNELDQGDYGPGPAIQPYNAHPMAAYQTGLNQGGHGLGIEAPAGGNPPYSYNAQGYGQPPQTTYNTHDQGHMNQNHAGQGYQQYAQANAQPPQTYAGGAAEDDGSYE